MPAVAEQLAQLTLDPVANVVRDDFGTPTLPTRPLIKDQWVEVRLEVNLATDTFSQFYGGQLLGSANQPWSTHSPFPGIGGAPNQIAIDAIDLYGNAPPFAPAGACRLYPSLLNTSASRQAE